MTEIIERHLLRVHLTTQKFTQEIIPEEDVKKFLGGRVLGDMLLYRELTPGTNPLSPQNNLIFGTGPITGTTALGSSRYIVLTKSPLTGLYLSSLAGGYFGPELRKADIDFIIIEGRAESPVYLSIIDDRIELRDARPFWGMTTDSTQEFIKDELGDSKVRISCIGPAGENGVLYAAIISERRAVGRGGAGTVMGSKNLKAIAVRGTGKVKVANPDAFQLAVKHEAEDIANNPVMSKIFPLYGTMSATPHLNDFGIMPWRNWQDSASPEAKPLFIQNWRDKYVKKDVHCAPPCNIRCGKIALASDGPYAGAITEGPEYEAEYSLGTCCGINDQTAVIEADSLCDKYGLDTISMGVSIAFAMECYEKGIITKKDTGGEEIKFGQAHLLSNLIHDTAYKQGFGELLSLGTKRMAEVLGKDSESFAMHVKGMELGGYDPRGAKSLALIFACGSIGGSHNRGGSCNGLSQKEVATGEARFSNKGKAAMVKASSESRALGDSAVMCTFPQGSLSGETIAELLSTATGFNLSVNDLRVVCERGSNIERAFNVREGLRRSWDILPERLLKESVKSGPNMGQVVELESLLDDFYKLCGWDIKTGIPTPEKLEELGLQEIAQDMESYLAKK